MHFHKYNVSDGVEIQRKTNGGGIIREKIITQTCRYCDKQIYNVKTISSKDLNSNNRSYGPDNE